MIESSMNLEFYDGKNDDGEIQYGRMEGKMNPALMAHVMDIS